MEKFNYFSEIKNGQTQKWISELNKKYLEISGVPVLVFKMDKVKTPKDNLYGEEKHSRIFLKPVEIMAHTLDPTWTQVMGFQEVQTYQENTQPVNVVVNFEDMVNKITLKKNNKLSSLEIEYKASGKISCKNTDGVLAFYKNDLFYCSFDLSVIKTVKDLNTEINNFPGMFSKMSGINAKSLDIINFNEVVFTGAKIEIYVRDKEFDNATDVFEKGDLILTPNNFLYEVSSNITTGEFGWDYSTYTMQCNRISIENITLPDGYIQKIYREDGKLSKIRREGFIDRNDIK